MLFELLSLQHGGIKARLLTGSCKARTACRAAPVNSVSTEVRINIFRPIQMIQGWCRLLLQITPYPINAYKDADNIKYNNMSDDNDIESSNRREGMNASVWLRPKKFESARLRSLHKLLYSTSLFGLSLYFQSMQNLSRHASEGPIKWSGNNKYSMSAVQTRCCVLSFEHLQYLIKLSTTLFAGSW